jgi:hypothetical protein
MLMWSSFLTGSLTWRGQAEGGRKDDDNEEREKDVMIWHL